MILTEKQQKHQLYHQVKIDNYKYLGEETLPSDERRVREQVTFIYSPLSKTFEKYNKTK